MLQAIIKMHEKFDHNPYLLSVGSYSTEHFSVLGFSTQSLSFNQHYYGSISFRLCQPVSLETCLHQPVCLSWPENNLHGIVTYVSEAELEFVSPLHFLTQQKRSRIYADKDFAALMQDVLSAYGWKIKQDFDFLLTYHYPASRYIAQYHETDLAFMQRQCSRWGINFGFIQRPKHAVLCFFDENDSIVQYFPEVSLSWFALSEYQLHRNVLPTHVNINDYNPETPDLDLSMEAQSIARGHQIDNRCYEFYQTRELGEVILKRRLEHYDSRREYVFIQTDDLTLQLGQKVILQEKSYLITEINFNANIRENIKHVDSVLTEIHKNYRPALPVLFHMPDVTAQIISEHVDEAGRYYISPDYDETCTVNTYPVRLAQPCVGSQIGFHFPLIKYTKIMMTHINGDPDRPVIVGVMPSESKPHPVTALNHSQHIVRTPQGNEWLIEDADNNSGMQFTTGNTQAGLYLFSDEMRCEAARHIMFEAQKINQTVSGDFEQIIKQEHGINVDKNYRVITEKGDAIISSGKNVICASSQLICHAAQQFNAQCETWRVNARDITTRASAMNINSAAEINIIAQKTNITAAEKIILTVGGSSITLSSAGIVFNASKVAFNTPSFNSPPPQLGASGGESSHLQFSHTLFNLRYKNLDDRVSHSVLKKLDSVVWAGNLRERHSFSGVDITQPLVMEHSNVPVIAVDGNAQKPHHVFRFQPQQHKTHDVVLLTKPKYKVISHQSEGLRCELLSPAEINYFKQQANHKIIIFIHGYNVSAGHFGKFDYIRTPQEGFTDDHVNGVGAPNWYLHMEYNLNCARQNRYLEFPWEEKSLEYKRILGIHWPGYKKIYDIPGTNGLNFAGMEFNAIASGYALLPLIKQIKDAGLDMTLIAHSLGNLVAIQLMDLLGRAHETVFERVYLWQAAVAKTALSPVIIDSLEQKRRAVQQSAEGSVFALAIPPLILYEYYGEFLRQKTAQFRHIPPWDLYEKDPFAYFPYAHYATKNICVLFSEHDDVLKWVYRANAIFANLPHYNFIYQALGLEGPDEETAKLLKHKLQCVDQRDCLFGHSEMRIPIQALFEKVYRLIIKEMGYES